MYSTPQTFIGLRTEAEWGVNKKKASQAKRHCRQGKFDPVDHAELDSNCHQVHGDARNSSQRANRFPTGYGFTSGPG